MDYSTWKEKQLPVRNILLDPRNPRIPPVGEPLDQHSLLAELVDHDKIYELAQNIVQNGYYPVESLIVVKEGGKTIVIEGNRRLAALKLLITPEDAPEDQIPKFRALSYRIDKVAIEKVKVVLAPKREATAPILMNRHTYRQIEAWEPIMQASFYSGLLHNGVTIDDLSREYNVSKLSILQSLRLYKMYQIACSLELPDNVAKIVTNPREFKATTLQRFYERPVSQEFLGIQLSTEVADIVGVIDEGEFKKGYKRVVTDIATGKIDSRSIGKTTQIRVYISNIPEQERPNLSKKGSFTSDTLLKRTGGEATEVIAKRGIASSRPKRKHVGLIPRRVSCDVDNQRINNIVNELRKLPVAKYPNATAVLFRSLLEMALSHYLDASGDLYVIIDDEKRRLVKINKPLKRNWHPSLKRMLRHLTGQKCNIIQNPNMKNALGKFTNKANELLSHDDLNFFVHNQYYAPNEESLRGYWGQLEDLFQIILVEPDTE